MEQTTWSRQNSIIHDIMGNNLPINFDRFAWTKSLLIFLIENGVVAYQKIVSPVWKISPMKWFMKSSIFWIFVNCMKLFPISMDDLKIFLMIQLFPSKSDFYQYRNKLFKIIMQRSSSLINIERNHFTYPIHLLSN